MHSRPCTQGHNLQKFINVDHLDPVRIQEDCSDDDTDDVDVESQKIDIEEGPSPRHKSTEGISLQNMESTTNDVEISGSDEEVVDDSGQIS